MGMMHFSSGKHGLDYYTPDKYCDPFTLFTRDMLKRIYAKEHELRRSDAIQQAYTEADSNFKQLEKITEDLQYEAIQSIKEDKLATVNRQVLLRHFRAARGFLAKDEEFKDATDYFQYDRAFQREEAPLIQCGSQVPVEGIHLHTLDGDSIPLSNWIHPNMNKPLLIFAGSLS